MKLADLSPQTIERIRKLRYDRIFEKHEGPEKWSFEIDGGEADLLELDGKHVLLPIPASQHANVSLIRSIVGDGGQSLTLFLKDTTFVRDPKWESLTAGFLAICDRLPGEDFYVAIVYHEWFMSAHCKLS